MENEETTEVIDEPQGDGNAAGQDAAASPGDVIDDVAVATESVFAPPEAPNPAPSAASGPVPDVRTDAIDVEAEFASIDRLNQDLEEGRIAPEDYNKQYASHQKNITKAQKAMIEPAKRVQQVIQRQDASATYWKNWGKGQDVAQKMYAAKIPQAKAAQLLAQARAMVEANPRYANRTELDPETIAYDKWMDLMDAETKKQPVKSSAPPPPTRITGGAGSAAPQGQSKTTQQKLNDGDYGDLAGEMSKVAGW